MTHAASSGLLTIVATPIGNLGDFSPRAADAIAGADLVCCEDTRTTGRLLALSGVAAPKLFALHEHNERERAPQLVDRLVKGASVVLVCDAGTPLVSDPGGRLVAAATSAGVTVTVVPGPSAVIVAIVLSGLGGERFRFEGFLPRRGAERTGRIEAVAAAQEPSVIYEAPGRVAQTIEDLRDVCGGDRRVAVARELTKLHEEVWRGVLVDAPDAEAVRIARGEYVIVVDHAPALRREDGDLDTRLVALAAAGLDRRSAVGALEVLLGVAHRRAYEAVLAHPAFGRASSTLEVAGPSVS